MFASLDVSEPDGDGLRFATVGSRALGRRADVSVFVSPGAQEGAPVVILLHGVLGSHWAWPMHGRVHVRLRALVEEGGVRPMVLLMPSDGLWGMGSGYVARAGEDFEAWIRDDMPALARIAHPGAGEDGICIGGLSMGGYGALRIASRNPDLFAAAAGTSSVTSLGQLQRITGSSYDVPAGEDRLLELIAAAGSRMPPFRLDCGTEDDLIKSNRLLHSALVDAGVEHEYYEYPGRHEWAYWIERIVEILLFFDRAFESRAR